MDKDKSPVAGGTTEEEKALLVSGAVSQTEKTVIGEHIFIEGSIRGEEHLVMEGSMQGSIEMKKHNFTIGTTGRFEGEIQAQNVSISGEIKGNINTKGKVKITKDADFTGEIKAKAISIEDGAYFKGVIELQREPHRKSALTDKKDTKSPPLPDQEADKRI
jgi:cytoskeletal protein CcmA (bactofilin family)